MTSTETSLGTSNLDADGTTESTEMNHILTDAASIQRYVLRGRSIFTLANKSSGTHLTYKVQRKIEGDIYWVSLLIGCDNLKDYRFFGTIFPDYSGGPHWFKHSTNGKITKMSTGAQAWDWFFYRLTHKLSFPSEFVFYRPSRCTKCGAFLTTPESIDRGYGDECWNIVHHDLW